MDAGVYDLRDFGAEYLSSMFLYEYNCYAWKMRRLTYTYHSENMGKGYIVFKRIDATSWRYIAPNTDYETAYKLACGIK